MPKKLKSLSILMAASVITATINSIPAMADDVVNSNETQISEAEVVEADSDVSPNQIVWGEDSDYSWSYDWVNINNITFRLKSSDTVAVTDGNNILAEELVLPSKIKVGGKYYNVTEIGEYSFCGNSNLTTVVIPYNVKSIGEYTFSGCANLKNVVLSEGLKSIGKFTFNNCYEINTIAIPASVESIGMGAFVRCFNLSSIAFNGTKIKKIEDNLFAECKKLKEVSLPEGVESIGTAPFTCCTALESLILPSTVKNIGYDIILGCTSLKTLRLPASVEKINEFSDLSGSGTEIIVDENNPNYAIYDGALCSKDGKTLLEYCGGSEAKDYTVPSTVTKINGGAFTNCKLKSIVLPDSVTELGDCVFQNSKNLTKIVLSNNINNIPMYTFDGCTSLDTVVIPGQADYDYGAFEGCDSVTKVYTTASQWNRIKDNFPNASLIEM